MSPMAEIINGLLDALRLEPMLTKNGYGITKWESERERVIDSLIKKLEAA